MTSELRLHAGGISHLPHRRRQVCVSVCVHLTRFRHPLTLLVAWLSFLPALWCPSLCVSVYLYLCLPICPYHQQSLPDVAAVVIVTHVTTAAIIIFIIVM